MTLQKSASKSAQQYRNLNPHPQSYPEIRIRICKPSASASFRIIFLHESCNWFRTCLVQIPLGEKILLFELLSHDCHLPSLYSKWSIHEIINLLWHSTRFNNPIARHKTNWTKNTQIHLNLSSYSTYNIQMFESLYIFQNLKHWAIEGIRMTDLQKVDLSGLTKE